MSSDENVAAFVNATETSEQEARSFLRRANGDLSVALAMYFGSNDHLQTTGIAGSAQRGPIASSLDALAGAASQQSAPTSGSGTGTGARSSTASSSSSSLHRAPRHRFATFSDLRREEEEARSAGSRGGSRGPGGIAGFGGSDSDDPAQFFTGGERSALAVTNPNDVHNRRGALAGPGGAERTAASSLVDEIIRKAQQRAEQGGIGGENDDDLDESQPHNQGRRQPVFSGRGARLGRESEAKLSDDDDDDMGFDDLGGDGDDDTDLPVLQRTMYFWRDGFSIDDGPLYRFDDPQNAVYLRAINMGRAPIELLRVHPHQAVDVKLVQRSNEDYVKPKSQPTLDNAGPGRRLGSATTVPTYHSPSPQPQSQQPDKKPGLGAEGNATVQLRLADGTVRRLRFDAQGAVQQLYDYVDGATQPSSARAYVLMLPMPPQKLEDKQQTLESAGVVGAVVVQRWI